MKSLVLGVSSSVLLSLGAAHAAVTFTVANYTGSSFGPNGLPIVTNAGVPVLAATGAYASIGYLTSIPTEGSVQTAASLISLFNAVDLSPVPIGTNPGLFNGQDYSSATNVYPAGFVGKKGYLMVGNNATLASSTAIAMFTLDTLFPAANADNTASYTIALSSSTASIVYGSIVDVTVQPRIDANDANNYAKGAVMVSSGTFGAVPEPSAALLGAIGALGLLRRRRI